MDIKSVLIASDSFKGCLSSKEVGDAVRTALLRHHPEMHVAVMEVADGGEGMADILGNLTGAEHLSSPTLDPLLRPINASYRYHRSSRTAYIDMAASGGLPILSASERNPMHTSTYGVGLIMRHATLQGARHLVIGLGGSATTDAGLGALSALGMRCLDAEGGQIPYPVGADLPRVVSIDTTDLATTLQDMTVTLAVDVDSPMCGPQGAAYIFAPQKGASPQEVTMLDDGLAHIGHLFNRYLSSSDLHIDILSLPGGGAAGALAAGLYFGVMMAQGAEPTMCSGADLILDTAGFDHLASLSDLIITGEGGADAQSLMGKITGTILHRTQALATSQSPKQCWLITGCLRDADILTAAGFHRLIDINANPSDPEADPLNPTVALSRILSCITNTQ